MAKLTSIKNRSFEIEGNYYIFYGRITYNEQEDLTGLESEHKEEIKKINDLREYVISTIDISHIGRLIDFMKSPLKTMERNSWSW